MSTITVIGSLNYDLVTFTNKVPAGGETYQANSFENHLGGKGLNEALAAARLSSGATHKVRMVGNIGDDSFGKELKQALVDAKVDTEYIKTIKNQSSGVAVILVEEESGENRILITAGANGDLKPTQQEYQTYFSQVDGDQYVILQNEYPHTIESINWIHANHPKINISYNPSPYKPELITEKTWAQIDLLIVNEGEALDVAANLLSSKESDEFKTTIENDKVKGFSQLAGKLQQLINPKNVSTVVITMGSAGSIYTSKEIEPTFAPSVKVDKVIDTTGAGDTFFGGVVLQLAAGESLPTAIKFATIASSIVIQKKGAAESIPTIKDVKKHL